MIITVSNVLAYSEYKFNQSNEYYVNEYNKDKAIIMQKIQEEMIKYPKLKYYLIVYSFEANNWYGDRFYVILSEEELFIRYNHALFPKESQYIRIYDFIFTNNNFIFKYEQQTTSGICQHTLVMGGNYILKDENGLVYDNIVNGNEIKYNIEYTKSSISDNNYIYITSPLDNYKTNLKDISILITYKLSDVNNIQDYEIIVTDDLGNLLDDKIVYKEILQNDYNINNNSIEGTINIHYKFRDFGQYKIKATMINKNKGIKYESPLKTINIIAFKDENYDGKDDNTGEKYEDIIYWNNKSDNLDNKEKTRSEYPEGILGDVQYYFEKLINIILAPFKLVLDGIKFIINQINTLLGSILGFNNIINEIFSVFPAELKSMIYLGISSLIIISIIKFMRS